MGWVLIGVACDRCAIAPHSLSNSMLQGAVPVRRAAWHHDARGEARLLALRFHRRRSLPQGDGQARPSCRARARRRRRALPVTRCFWCFSVRVRGRFSLQRVSRFIDQQYQHIWINTRMISIIISTIHHHHLDAGHRGCQSGTYAMGHLAFLGFRWESLPGATKISISAITGIYRSMYIHLLSHAPHVYVWLDIHWPSAGVA